jgi:hypothetical protein
MPFFDRVNYKTNPQVCEEYRRSVCSVVRCAITLNQEDTAIGIISTPHLNTNSTCLPKQSAMAAEPNDTVTLSGFCACERNKYSIAVDPAQVHHVHVFFDNSAASRRVQASPVTVWLRVPLAWYSSFTIAHFEKESHALIKRTFHAYSAGRSKDHSGDSMQIRRQFCGFCGTHLTKLDEVENKVGGTVGLSQSIDDTIDVTLGSLDPASLESLERLGVLPSEDSESDDGCSEAADEQRIDEEAHIADRIPESKSKTGAGLSRKATVVNGEYHFLASTAPITTASEVKPMTSSTSAERKVVVPHRMYYRGIPYFESMVENSRLGRIRYRKAGPISRDGSASVHWDVVEIENELPEGVLASGSEVESARVKRTRLA